MKGSAGHDHDEEDYDDVHGSHADEAGDGEAEEESLMRWMSMSGPLRSMHP